MTTVLVLGAGAYSIPAIERLRRTNFLQLLFFLLSLPLRLILRDLFLECDFLMVLSSPIRGNDDRGNRFRQLAGNARTRP